MGVGWLVVVVMPEVMPDSRRDKPLVGAGGPPARSAESEKRFPRVVVPYASSRSQRDLPRPVGRTRRRRARGGGRRGGALLAAQARQAAGAVRGVGTARPGHALVPCR